MIILITLFVVCVLSGLFAMAYNGCGDLDMLGAVVSLISGFALLVALISIPINRMGIAAFEVNIEAVRVTMPENVFQDAAWRTKAASMNGDLAEWKYYRTIFPLWIPASIENVNPL